jgi:hypothetical protein
VSGFPSGALSAALAWLRGISVAIDQGRKPTGVAAGAGWAVLDPFYIPRPTKPLEGGTVDAQAIYQITTFGYVSQQAELLLERLDERMLAADLDVPGVTIWKVDSDDTQPVNRDDAVQPPLFWRSARYRIFLTTS